MHKNSLIIAALFAAASIYALAGPAQPNVTPEPITLCGPDATAACVPACARGDVSDANCVTRPRPLRIVDPEYSEEARRKDVQGAVLLSIVIGPDGKVGRAEVIRGLGHGLDEQAIRAAKSSTFSPATMHGKPVAVTVPMEFTFRRHVR